MRRRPGTTSQFMVWYRVILEGGAADLSFVVDAASGGFIAPFATVMFSTIFH